MNKEINKGRSRERESERDKGKIGEITQFNYEL